MFPVHTWLPDAAQQAPAGTSTLLVGVLDKVGTFGMLTLCLPLFPAASRWAAPVIIVLAVDLDPVRGAARHRAEGPHAAHRVHVGVALRLHRAGHLRLHVDVGGRLVVLHGQPRPLDRRAVPARRLPGRASRVAADRRLRRAAEGRAGARRARSWWRASRRCRCRACRRSSASSWSWSARSPRHPAAAVVASARRGARRALRPVDLPADLHRARQRPASRGCRTWSRRERWVVAPADRGHARARVRTRPGARPRQPARDRHARAGRGPGRAVAAPTSLPTEGSDK